MQEVGPCVGKPRREDLSSIFVARFKCYETIDRGPGVFQDSRFKKHLFGGLSEYVPCSFIVMDQNN